MKNKFALCFRPVTIETVEKEEEEEEEAKRRRRRNSRSLSLSDHVNHTASAPFSRHDLRRGNSSSRKTLSAALKSILFPSSSRLAMVPKATKEGDDHMGIDQIKEEKETKKTFSNTSISPSNSLISSSSSTSTSSSSMNSLEMNNFKAISLKRSLLARSNSTSIHHKKKLKTTKAKDKLALKSSPKQEGFVFYLVILAILLNILCGFVYSIVLTSLSLYFIGLYRMQQLGEDAVKLPEIGKSRRTTDSK